MAVYLRRGAPLDLSTRQNVINRKSYSLGPNMGFYPHPHYQEPRYRYLQRSIGVGKKVKTRVSTLAPRLARAISRLMSRRQSEKHTKPESWGLCTAKRSF